MKIKSIFEGFLTVLIVFIIFLMSKYGTAQTVQHAQRHASYVGVSAMVTVKANEVTSKEDIDKVKQALSTFGYKIFNFKINFEKKEVLVRCRKPVAPEEIVAALNKAGYTSSYNDRDQISMNESTK